MRLLGVPLLLVLALLAVLLPVAALLVWRGPRRRVVTALASILLILGGQAAGVGLVAAAVNRSGGYYTSWSELVGAGAAPPAIRHVSARPAGPLGTHSLTTHSDPSFSSRSQWATRGRLEHLTLTGASSGLTAHGYLYLPAQYFQDRHTRFPSSEVLTGYPGSARNLVHALDYPGVLRGQVGAGLAHPMVLAMLRPSLSYRRDLECTDVPGGPQALTFLSQDLPSAISTRFRVHPTHWGAIGDSTGGYCSTKLAMTNPATFSAAVSLSGYYQSLQDHTTGDLYAALGVLALASGRQVAAPPPAWFTAAMLLATLLLAIVLLRRYRHGSAPGLAALAGACFGGSAVGARALDLGGGWVAVAGQPVGWTIVALGVVGSLAYARSLERGSAGTATATVWVVEVVLSGVVGIAVLGDHVLPGWDVPALVAVVVAVLGCVLLAQAQPEETLEAVATTVDVPV